MNDDREIREMLRRIALKSLIRLRDPDADTRTIAEAMRQTTELALAELAAAGGQTTSANTRESGYGNGNSSEGKEESGKGAGAGIAAR